MVDLALQLLTDAPAATAVSELHEGFAVEVAAVLLLLRPPEPEGVADVRSALDDVLQTLWSEPGPGHEASELAGQSLRTLVGRGRQPARQPRPGRPAPWRRPSAGSAH